MMNRVIFRYIAIRFFMGCICLASFPLISQATMVQISEEESLATAKVLSKHLPNDKQKASPLRPENKFYSYLHTDSIAFSAIVKNTVIKKQQAEFFQTGIKEIGKAWITKNLDNEYMQEPLLTYKKTKLLYNKTDEFLTNLTQDLLLTLELEQLARLTPLPKTETQQKLYRSVTSNSERKTNEVIVYNESDNIFLRLYKQIVKIETVFYLVISLLLYFILKWAVKQFLVKRY